MPASFNTGARCHLCVATAFNLILGALLLPIGVRLFACLSPPPPTAIERSPWHMQPRWFVCVYMPFCLFVCLSIFLSHSVQFLVQTCARVCVHARSIMWPCCRAADLIGFCGPTVNGKSPHCVIYLSRCYSAHAKTHFRMTTLKKRWLLTAIGIDFLI